MFGSLRILALLSDGFGGFGGISKFNIDFLQALGASRFVDRVWALPRIISDPNELPIPEAVIYDVNGARGKASFVRRLVAGLLQGHRPNMVICAHLNLLPLAHVVAAYHRAPLVLIIHGVECWQPQFVRRFFCKRIRSVISVSRLSAERFCAWSGVPIDRATILPNSIDLDVFTPQPRDPQLVKRYGLEGSKVVLTVGRLVSREREKGFDAIIDVMPRLLQRIPNTKYLIVGDGPDRDRLRSKVTAAGLANNVIFVGKIPEEEKVMHYNLADVYAMPSKGEGFGIVLIEAAACGVPIVGSEADGSREALLGGQLGRLVHPDNTDDLLDAVAFELGRTKPHIRNKLVEFFSAEQFRNRVDVWAQSQLSSG